MTLFFPYILLNVKNERAWLKIGCVTSFPLTSGFMFENYQIRYFYQISQEPMSVDRPVYKSEFRSVF